MADQASKGDGTGEVNQPGDAAILPEPAADLLAPPGGDSPAARSSTSIP